MADNEFEEVVRLVFDSTSLTQGLARAQKEISEVGGLFKEDGKFSKGIGRVDQRLQTLTASATLSARGIEEFVKPFENLNSALADLGRMEQRLDAVRRAAERLAAVRANKKGQVPGSGLGGIDQLASDITPQFETGSGGTTSPRIINPQKELANLRRQQEQRLKIIQDGVADVRRLEEKDAEERVARGLKETARLRKIEEDKQRALLREEEQGIIRREKLRQKAITKEIADAERSAKRVAAAESRRISGLRKDQQGLARGFTVGAAAAGAFGNFRGASALFGIGSVIRGLDVESLKPGQSIISGLASAALKATPAVAALVGVFGALALAVKSIKLGAVLEKELARASTLFNLGKASVQEFNTAMEKTEQLAVKLSNEFNISTTEAIEGFKTALSAGIEVSELEEFSKQATTLSTALGTSFEKSTDILTTLRDSYKLSISELARVNAILFNSIDEGKFVVDDLVNNLGRVAPIASTAGVSIETLFGVLAFATRQGLKPTQAITSTAQFLESIVDPSDKAKKAFKELGIQFGKSATEGDNLKDTIKALSGLSFEDLAKLFPEDRSLRLAASFAQSSDAALKFIDTIQQTNNELADEASARALDNTIDRVGMLTNAFTNELAVAGVRALESITEAILGIDKGMTALEKRKITLGAVEGIRSFTDQTITGFNIILQTLGEVGDAVIHAGAKGFDNIGKAGRDIKTEFNDRLVESAKRLIEVGDEVGALGQLLKADFEYPQAIQFINDTKLDNKIASLTDSYNELGKALRTNVASALDKSLSDLSKTTGLISQLQEDIQKTEKDLAKQRLNSEERGQLKDIEEDLQNTEKQAELTRAKIAQIGQAAVADNAALIKKNLEELDKFIEEEGPTRVSTGERLLPESFIASVESARGAVRKLFEGGLISDEDTRALRGTLTNFIGAINVDDSNAAKKFSEQFLEQFAKATQNFDGVDFTDLIKDDKERFATATALNETLKVQEDEVKKLQTAEAKLVETGKLRPKGYVEAQKVIEKTLTDTEKLLDSVKKKEKKADIKLFAVNVSDIDLQIAKFQELLDLRVEQADVAKQTQGFEEQALGFATKAVDAYETLTELEKQREKLIKDRVDAVDELQKDINSLQEKDLQAFKDFEEKKTEDLKEELDKRKGLVKDFTDVFKDISTLRVANAVESATTDRQKQNVFAGQREQQLEAARQAISDDDIEGFKEAIAAAVNLLESEREFVDEGKRRGTFTNSRLAEIEDVAQQGRASFVGGSEGRARDILQRDAPVVRDQEALLKAVLQDRATEFSTLDKLTERLDDATVTIKGLRDPIDALTFVATSTKDFLQALIEKQSNEALPTAQATQTINISVEGQDRNDPAVRKVVEGVQEMQERGLLNNRFDKAGNIKSVNPTKETRTDKARGGAFGS